jgi:WD40 repeat protein
VAEGKQVIALEGHYGTVEAVAFSPDGKLLATGGGDGVIRLFDTATGRQLRPPDGHQALVSALAITPDGKILITGAHDRSIRMWALPTGEPIRTLTWERGKEWFNTQACVATLSVSEDGKKLASCDGDGPVRVWEIGNGKQIRTIEPSPVQPSASTAFFRDGGSLLLGGMDGVIGVWDVTSGRKVKAFDRVTCVGELAISPDRTIFARRLGGHPLTIELRSAQSGDELITFAIPYDRDSRTFYSAPIYLAFSSDGKFLAAARDNEVEVVRHPVRLFEISTKKEILAFGSGMVTELAYSPDGKTIVSAGASGTLSFWDRSTGARKDWFGTGQWGIRSLVFSLDGKTLYSGGDDGTICGWDLRP